MEVTKNTVLSEGKPVDYVGITNDFMFYSVMENREICKEFLERVLNIEIVELELVHSQKNIKTRKNSKGVRLDVYARDIQGNSYDIEMQTTDDPDVAKRTRYYHSEMDVYQLKKGRRYFELGKNIVIFVCTYDPFGKGRSFYTFKSICEEDTSVVLDDESQSIFLNVKGNREGIDGRLSNLLDYIKTGNTCDDYTENIQEQVELLNNDVDWRDKYMTLEMKMDKKYREGRQDGLQEGLQQGQLQMLMKLVESGEMTIARAASLAGVKEDEFEVFLEQMKNQ